MITSVQQSVQHRLIQKRTFEEAKLEEQEDLVRSPPKKRQELSPTSNHSLQPVIEEPSPIKMGKRIKWATDQFEEVKFFKLTDLAEAPGLSGT
jgi:hypothetical protein